MKDLEVEQRVNRSKAVGDARVAKMNARDALLEVCFMKFFSMNISL